MFEDDKKKVIEAGIKLDHYGLIALSGGNVTVRLPGGEILITPSGTVYGDMVPEDILVMDIDGSIIEGSRKPSVDTKAILYILEHMPQINAVIHTHQPYATGVGLIVEELLCNLTTLANATRGSVKVCPYSSAASIQMGVETVNNIGDRLAVILKHHGVIAVGENLKQALYACVYLEEAAKTYSIAYSMNKNVPELTPEQVDRAVEIFSYYGQGTADLPPHLQ
ncbi:class II aldolase/adducin family protein [Lacrimispora sp.]|uniref:class II aldolase/adducin family protein n=1 Tax=Lacrimispora sp. TaxID=2719234 RepID=UPI0028AC5C73|nr:class II aldolase/adducin family protein [Lacrimispora sp.]